MTGLGMGIVFVVLTVLMVAIVMLGSVDRLLTRLSPGNGAAAAAPPGAPPTDEASASGPTPQVVAAISVALALAHAESASALAQAGEMRGGPSPWVIAGRLRALEITPGPRR